MKWFKKIKSSIPGLAAGKTIAESANEAASSEAKMSFTDISVTEVMGQDVLDVSKASLPSTTSASNITKTSSENTAWTESLLSVVERSWEELNSLDLDVLEPQAKNRLMQLVEGTGEPPAAIIWNIASFMSESESEFCEAPLLDGINFYLTTEQV